MKLTELRDALGNVIVLKKWKPIGTILMFDRKMNMSELYYGTWQIVLKERSPIGVNPESTDPSFNTAGKQFGEKEHKLTIDEIPSHNHQLENNPVVVGKHELTGLSSGGAWSDLGIGTGASITLTGGGKSHNNIHPVETVYFYKRIA